MVVVVVLALLMEPQVVLFEVGHSVEVVVEKVQERDLGLNKKKEKDIIDIKEVIFR